MSQGIALFTSLLALPLCAQQMIRKPSPFPEKNRETTSAVAAAADESRWRPSRSARRARSNAPAVSGPAAPATGAAASGQTGEASYFVSSAGGARTASGGQLNAAELVAAHATYPLGSRVNVTNLANGRTVEVRIVDRFPDSRRIINVSESAARQLGFLKAGTALVHLELTHQHVAPLDQK